MSLTPETESDEPKLCRRGERDVKKGDRIYLAGETQSYIVMHPTWVVSAPPDPESKRGGWMP